MYSYTFIQSLLNVLVQIANNMGFKKKALLKFNIFLSSFLTRSGMLEIGKVASINVGSQVKHTLKFKHFVLLHK
jgi:hypothetical protein